MRGSIQLQVSEIMPGRSSTDDYSSHKEPCRVLPDIKVKQFIRFLVVFAVVGVASAVAMPLFDIEFGTVNYWDHHGVGLLIGLALLPRLTLLLSSIATGGVLWWLSWFFVPRYLIAVLATVAYFETNPVLVVFAWLVALGGETTEKHYVQRKRAARRGASAAELGIDERNVIDV